jgi:hypothetical protein
MIATDTFVDFGRRMAATQGCPHVVIAVTPNPVRGLDPAALSARVEAMLPTIVEGFTLQPAEIERRGIEAGKRRSPPVRAQLPV